MWVIDMRNFQNSLWDNAALNAARITYNMHCYYSNNDCVNLSSLFSHSKMVFTKEYNVAITCLSENTLKVSWKNFWQNMHLLMEEN